MYILNNILHCDISELVYFMAAKLYDVTIESLHLATMRTDCILWLLVKVYVVSTSWSHAETEARVNNILPLTHVLLPLFAIVVRYVCFGRFPFISNTER